MAKKISLMFYKKDCMGCHACEVACKQEHNLEVGPRLVRVVERSPNFTPIYCHHCAKPPCGEACPSEAIHKTEDGLVLIDNEACIGCGECLQACPFGAMQFDEEAEVAIKCDLCADRLQEGLVPACASVCGTGCIKFGGTKEMIEAISPVR